jgi:hypothetical protein
MWVALRAVLVAKEDGNEDRRFAKILREMWVVGDGKWASRGRGKRQSRDAQEEKTIKRCMTQG